MLEQRETMGSCTSELQRAADHRCPRGEHREIELAHARPFQISAAIIAAFQTIGADIRKEKAAMAVEDTEAPGGEHEQPGAGKEDAHERDRQLARLAPANPGAMSSMSQRRDERCPITTSSDVDKREQRGHGARDVSSPRRPRRARAAAHTRG